MNKKENMLTIASFLKHGTILICLLVLASCSSNAKKENATESAPDSTIESTSKDVSASTSETYQHVAMATVKDEKWDDLLAAMHNNIAHSRQEEGNILFTFMQPDDGSHDVVWVERFKNRAAFEEHAKAEYLPEQEWADSKDGEMTVHELKEVAEIPAVEPENSDDLYSPRNVVVFFDVKPENRQSFIEAIATLTPQARQAEGNVRFNIFQHVDDQNKFVLVESWSSVANHEKHLAQDYSKKFDEAVSGYFVSNPADTRILAKDISK